jgi:hypothetical protein
LSVAALFVATLASAGPAHASASPADPPRNVVSVETISPHDYNGPIVIAYLTHDGVTLFATGNTVAWNYGTINIRGELWANGVNVWDRTNTCYGSSCTLPTYSTCPVHGVFFQLLVSATGPSTAGHTYVSDEKGLTT